MLASAIRRVLMLALFVVTALVTSAQSAHASSGGIQNTWGFNTTASPYLGAGCNGCHSGGSSATPALVSAPTPIILANSETMTYTITVSAVVAGINATAFNLAGGTAGTLATTCGTSPCGTLKTIGSPVQITHTTPHCFGGTYPSCAGTGNISFSFTYTAPASGCYQDEIQIWVASVNQSGSTSGDHANRYDVLVSNQGSACSDGNACTQVDACDATGSCVGSSPVVCTSPPTCHVASGASCDPGSGSCSYPNAADNSSCDDGNACTTTDSCQSGTCTGANPVQCTALDACHDVGVCNSVSGTCTTPNKQDGSACDDQNACDMTDTCTSGVCSGVNPVVCPPPDQCHDQGSCNAATGSCSNPAKGDGTACDAHDRCSTNDTCVAGVCTKGAAIVCTAPDECHEAGTCNPATGNCSNPAKRDGTSCANGGTCARGVCSSAADGGQPPTDGGQPSTGSPSDAGTGTSANDGGSSRAASDAGGGSSKAGSDSGLGVKGRGSAGAGSAGAASDASVGQGSAGHAGSFGGSTKSSGCGCRVIAASSQANAGAHTAMLLLLVMAVRGRWRRRRNTPADQERAAGGHS